MTPQYLVTCAAFVSDPLVTVTMIDGTEIPLIRKRYDISGYPKLLMFPEVGSADSVKEPVYYKGPRKHRDILTFVNDQVGTSRLVNGTLGNDAGTIPSLDTIITTTKEFDLDFLNVLDRAISGLEESGGFVKQAHQNSFKHYRAYAKKTVEKGKQYPQQELQRLKRLMQNPLTAKAKVEEFQIKMNIISKFLGPEFFLYTGDQGLVEVI